ncbi:hypothetical protein K0M31_012919 [Melipona bicolor]|uniref:Uncharacterized protein n=1 Tax=Melipona bicolor TaxID=60889 RepID=A0AA40FIY4_9HYME|nr:hypothetical protein K0M31_012919 [Melipona bicolor]
MIFSERVNDWPIPFISENEENTRKNEARRCEEQAYARVRHIRNAATRRFLGPISSALIDKADRGGELHYTK